MSNRLPDHLWEDMLLKSNLTGRELASLASTSTKYRRIIMNSPELMERWESNRRWSQVPLRELERIASDLRKSRQKGYWTNKLLAKYEYEISRRKKGISK